MSPFWNRYHIDIFALKSAISIIDQLYQYFTRAFIHVTFRLLSWQFCHLEIDCRMRIMIIYVSLYEIIQISQLLHLWVADSAQGRNHGWKGEGGPTKVWVPTPGRQRPGWAWGWVREGIDRPLQLWWSGGTPGKFLKTQMLNVIMVASAQGRQRRGMGDASPTFWQGGCNASHPPCYDELVSVITMSHSTACGLSFFLYEWWHLAVT